MTNLFVSIQLMQTDTSAMWDIRRNRLARWKIWWSW